MFYQRPLNSFTPFSFRVNNLDLRCIKLDKSHLVNICRITALCFERCSENCISNASKLNWTGRRKGTVGKCWSLGFRWFFHICLTSCLSQLCRREKTSWVFRILPSCGVRRICVSSAFRTAQGGNSPGRFPRALMFCIISYRLSVTRVQILFAITDRVCTKGHSVINRGKPLPLTFLFLLQLRFLRLSQDLQIRTLQCKII